MSAPQAESSAQALLERWQRLGDRDALHLLLRAEVEVLCQRLRRKVGPRLDPALSASDLVQEAVARFLRLEEPPALGQPEHLRAYLWRAAWRLFLDRMRSPGAAIRRLDAAESGSLSGLLAQTGGQGAVDRQDQGEALQLALHLIPDADRDVLERVYLRQQPIEAAALELDVPRATLDMRLSRARRRLAERLVDWAELIG
jgi:RNA polymerase sigma factor (sigma-70 family)